MAQITTQRVDEGICVIRPVNPPEGFLTPAMLPALRSAFDAASADSTVRVIVLTGGLNRVFIQHFWDPERCPQAPGPAASAEARPVPAAFPRRLRELCERIELSPKPVIAAINGTCLGGGLELALACDLRVAQAGHYSIGPTEIHLGVLPAAGGTQRLVHLIGAARAFEVIALGRTLSPEAAAAIGLVCQVAANALDESLRLARQLAARPGQALAHLKTLIRQAHEGGTAADRAGRTETLCLDLWNSSEAVSLMNAFNRGEFDIREGYPSRNAREIAQNGIPTARGPVKLRSV